MIAARLSSLRRSRPVTTHLHLQKRLEQKTRFPRPPIVHVHVVASRLQVSRGRRLLCDPLSQPRVKGSLRSRRAEVKRLRGHRDGRNRRFVAAVSTTTATRGSRKGKGGGRN